MVSWPSRLLRAAAPTRGYALLCAGIAVVTVALSVAFVTGLGGPIVSQNLSNVSLFVAALAAAWGCLSKMLQTSGGRVR